MRKHFLILMLLTLLPLAGWAEAVNLNTVAVNITLSNTYSDGAYQLEYTGATTAPGLNALTIGGTEIDINTWDDLYEFEYFASADAETPLTDFKKAGTYWVGIKAKEGNEDYTGSCAAANRVKAIINKATLHITLQNAEKVYGQDDPTSLQVVPVSGLKGNDDINGIGVTFVQAEGDYPLPRQTKKAVGTWNYTFTLNAVSTQITATNYDIILDANPTLTITPAELTVYYDVDNEENPTKSNDIVVKYNGTVGFTFDADEDKLFVTGWQYEDEESSDLGDITLTASAKTANVGPEGDDAEDLLAGKEAHTVTIALANVTNGKYGNNYTVTYVKPALYVQQATITADDFTFAQTTPNFTYDGAAHTPAGITVKYVDNTGEEPVVLETLTQGADKDFTISYTWRVTGGDGDFAADEHGNTFAGSYKANVSAVEGGNYYTGESLPVAGLDYTIKQRGLTIYAGDYAPTYTGAAASLDNVEIGWSGLTLGDIEALDEDEKDVDDYFEVKFIDADNEEIAAPTNAGSYKVKTFAKEAFAGADLAVNYKPSFGKANYTIQKKAATITAAAQSITFGEDVEIDDNVVVKDDDEHAEDYTVTFDGIIAGDVANVTAKISLALDATREYNAVDDYEGAILVDSIAGNVANVLDNYQITFVAGTFSIEASTFTVYAKTNSKVYGTAYTLDAEGGFDYGKINFSGTWPEGVTVTYQLKATEDGEALTELPKAVGTYYIVPVVNNWPTEGTDYAEPQIQMGIFKITKKTVYIKPNALNLNNGVTEDVLETLGSVKYYSDEDCENETPLAYESDKIKSTLAFNVYDAEENEDDEALILNGDDELNCVEGETYEHAIVVTANPEEEGFANKNYDIHVVFGEVTILNANTLVISNTDANMYNKIQLAADACDPEDEDTFWDVTFSVGRTLKANKWESFVLPFEVSVGQLSAALKAAAGQDYGYAIFNVYNESSSDASNVRFSLNMTNIPANTPFLVKTEKDVALGTNVVIEDVCIIDPESANPTKEVAGKVTMVGCYEDTPITKNDYFFFQGTWLNGADSTTEPTILPATMAYWTPADPKARVFVEDFENGTTVIKEISAETMREIAADGWYTVNGIKLQSIPTEKGVYINNGKKVVIK